MQDGKGVGFVPGKGSEAEIGTMWRKPSGTGSPLVRYGRVALQKQSRFNSVEKSTRFLPRGHMGKGKPRPGVFVRDIEESQAVPKEFPIKNPFPQSGQGLEIQVPG